MSRIDASNPASSIDRVNSIVAKAFCALLLIHNGTILGLVNPGLMTVPLALMAVIVLYGLVFVMLSGNALVATVGLAVSALPAIQFLVFATTFSTPVNWNAAFSFVAISGFCVFYMARHDLDAVVAFAAKAALAYCALYIVMSLNADALSDGGAVRVLGGDERGTRVYFAMGFGALALFYSVARLRETRSIAWLLAVAVCCAAFYLSGSRTITLLVAGALVVYLFGMRTRPFQILYVIAIVAAFAASIWGVLALDWNLFSAFSGDSSGVARAHSFSVLKPYIDRSPFFGMGLSPDGATFMWAVGGEFVFWEDLGPFGVWVALGLSGLLYFWALAILCILGPRRGVALSVASTRALQLGGLAFGFYAVISPNILSGDGVIVSGVILATWLMPAPRRSGVSTEMVNATGQAQATTR